MKSKNNEIKKPKKVMNKTQATKKDTGFYATFCEDGLYRVFGIETGFSYSTFCDRESADNYAREMNKSKVKKRILALDKVKACSVELAEKPMENHWCKIWFDFKYKWNDQIRDGRKEIVSRSVNYLVKKVEKFIQKDKKDYEII